jgi:surfeit locus 1 family protein
MPARILAFVAVAFALAAVFVRLGFWQLERLGQRRAVNATVEAQLARPPIPFTALQGDSEFRRVIVTGIPDTANEILHIGRSRAGSPGVHILTPMRLPESDTAVLVNRGWVYAPDAASAELTRWREDRTEFSGFAVPLSGTTRGTNPSGRRVRALDHAALQTLLPYPVSASYVVAEDSAGADAPVRVARPVLGNGPHLSYAIQWFCFAAIAVGGAIAIAVRARRATAAGATGA